MLTKHIPVKELPALLPGQQPHLEYADYFGSFDRNVILSSFTLCCLSIFLALNSFYNFSAYIAIQLLKCLALVLVVLQILKIIKIFQD